ncbi:MAG: SDR family oxidoreductase [Sandaracinaceae bacterium]|nr:SDR family oxidoreductase [Sandaracinaceae bacterium]MCC6877884.1 SDR family oxidoreductase [Sandaracinaceae bacterium]
MKFFVTGGARGIGEAIVVEALRRGHEVAFTYRSSADAAKHVLDAASDIANSGACRAYPLDVRDPEAVEVTAERVLDDFGQIDVVVNNAGINVNGLCASYDDAAWREVIDTNLSGAFYVCRAFLPSMMKKGFGRLIHVSSLGRGGVTGQVAYAASKAGLLGLSSTLAKEYGRRGITSNVVAPGFFETDMTREGMSGSNREFWLKYCPLGRLGELPEIAGVVMFLASNDASYVNGETITVTGGLDWAP